MPLFFIFNRDKFRITDMETPLFFKNKDYNLFGVLHEPDTPSSSLQPLGSNLNQLGIVFCHPFAEEKISSHRVMVNFARFLANHGIAVFRFDFMGHGDSEGNFEDATIETRLSDIGRAVKYLKDKTGLNKIGLLGVQFGATLGALHAQNDNSIDFLILINPIIRGGPYIDLCLRSNLATQIITYQKIIKNRKQLIEALSKGEKVNVDGYLLTKELYFEMKSIDLTRQFSCNSNHILIIQISKRATNAVDKNLQRLHELYLENNCVSEISNIHCDAFWVDSRIYTAETVPLYRSVFEWCQRVNVR